MAADRLNIVQGSATIAIGGADVGYTSENGVTITVTPTFYEHKTDQVKASLKATLTDRKVMINFEMIEADLDRVLLAINEAAASLSGSSLTIDDTQGADADVVVVGTPPSVGTTRTAMFYACQVKSEFTVTMSKNEPCRLNMEMEAYWSDSDNSLGIMGDA